MYLHSVGGREPDGKPTRIGKWTFGTRMVREVVERHLRGDVLNACAGKTRLDVPNCEIETNDINPEIDSDHSVDVRGVNEHFEPESFDCVILDPPFDPGRAEKLYEGWHASGYTQARVSVGEVVKRGGVVIELGWNSWGLGDSEGWDRVEHHLYRQAPFKADVHLLVDRKINQRSVDEF